MNLSIENRFRSNPVYAWRTENNITRVQIASALKVSITTVYLWEAGTMRPTADHLERLVRITGIIDLPERWATWYESSNHNPNPEERE